MERREERRANGYEQYGVAHLVRVLRIKRLTELGFSSASNAISRVRKIHAQPMRLRTDPDPDGARERRS